jgi:hypothetical protein
MSYTNKELVSQRLVEPLGFGYCELLLLEDARRGRGPSENPDKGKRQELEAATKQLLEKTD